MKKQFNTKLSKILTKEFLIKEYTINKKSTYQIAQELNIPQCTVYWYLKKYNTKTRTLSQANKGKKLTAEQCKARNGKNNWNYIDGRCSKIYYCKESNCNSVITYQDALYGSGRCRSCASRIQNTGRKQTKESIRKRAEAQKGSKHWNWKGGISSLECIIRTLLEYKQWRREVFKRDYWTCQECGYKGKSIEAHHKRQFAKLLQEFLQEYNQFSPIEDKETLVRLAIKWKPFWNIYNGQTLCKGCHNLTKTKSKE